MPTLEQRVSGGSRLSYTTKETAVAIRAALKAAFPGVKFGVTTSYASMTSSTHIRWTDGPTEPEVERVTNRFTSRGFDGSTDSTTYHEQTTADGQRVSYSGWVTTRRELSAALLQKALHAYQRQRAEYGYGPAALTIQDGAYPQIVGADVSTLNPCGGRATWCPDAVHHIAYTMRPNGCRVTLKTETPA